MAERTASVAGKAASSAPTSSLLLQRKCSCGTHTPGGGECTECARKRLQRKPDGAAARPAIPPSVHEVLRAPGQALDAAARGYFERGFGRDFSRVRIHADERAAESARAVDARAYTVGQDVVFGRGQFAPATTAGRQLIAHELAHVLQQRGAGSRAGAPLAVGDPASAAEAEADRAAADIVAGRKPQVGSGEPQRLARVPCSPAATCASGTVAGSSADFSVSESTREAGPRARRKRMTPARATATGHSGRARQLEHFLSAQAPGRLAIIQGIFIDADMSPGTAAFTQDCATWIGESLPTGAPTPPGMVGATKKCVFVPGHLNREALTFNTTASATIGGMSRERWRIDTLQTLIHETEHPRFEAATAGQPRPAGVTSATCTRNAVEFSLSEIAAVLSEFTTIARSAAAEASATGPRHAQLNAWFASSVHSGGENIEGNLLQMGCTCSCAEVRAFIRETFDNVTTNSGWTAAEKAAFNTRMRTELPAAGNPSWPL